MFDLDWERSIPMCMLDSKRVSELFSRFDRSVTVLDFQPIRCGCRNTNIVVETDRGKFLLRLADPNGLCNEKVAYEIVSGKIKVPVLWFHTFLGQRQIFLYEYIEGPTLQELLQTGRYTSSLIRQVAFSSATLHSIPLKKSTGLKEFDLPPFEQWFPAFLEAPGLITVTGKVLHNRIWRLVKEKSSFLPEIERLCSLIHCDFRPLNMLVDKSQQIFFIDWENTSTGHTLADVGQFFRYRWLFSHKDIPLFEEVYNSYASFPLPKNWYELSLFRDLINPLQIIASQPDAPRKKRDLLGVIENTLTYWGY